MSDTPSTNIVFLLFPGITQLDFTAPAQALSRMPGAVISSAAATLDLHTRELEILNMIYCDVMTLAELEVLLDRTPAAAV